MVCKLLLRAVDDLLAEAVFFFLKSHLLRFIIADISLRSEIGPIKWIANQLESLIVIFSLVQTHCLF